MHVLREGIWARRKALHASFGAIVLCPVVKRSDGCDIDIIWCCQGYFSSLYGDPDLPGVLLI